MAIRDTLACCFQQIQRPDRICIEIVERDRRCTVVRRLRSGMNDRIRLQFANQREHAGTVANIKLVMNEAGNQI